MKKQIELDKKAVEYTLKQGKRARRMRVAIYCGGEVVVTAPRFMGEDVIERFLRERAGWILDKIEYFKKRPAPKVVKASRAQISEYKKRALALAEERIRHFNAVYGFKYRRIFIKNQKTRWGSCSRKGNLNFNYKIALLPPELANYIIAHELCHLGEFNHSRKFWSLVAQTIPDYNQKRKALRLHRISFT